MAQSNNESNVKRIPPFWQNHTVDPPTLWEDWSDLFHLAIIAKENIDIENLKKSFGKTSFPTSNFGKSDGQRIEKPKKIENRQEYTRTKTLRRGGNGIH